MVTCGVCWTSDRSVILADFAYCITQLRLSVLPSWILGSTIVPVELGLIIMALDAQSNWNVSMAENLERTMTRSNRERIDSVNPRIDNGLSREIKAMEVRASAGSIHLPDEIIIHILDYVQRFPTVQQTLAACTKLNHQWYSITVPLLYRAPNLEGRRYDAFVRSICPSINLHVRKSPLSSLVKVLDLRNLVHQGSKSMTARLLGRTKGNLEEFCAPQASFAINCLPALSKCAKLRVLDLTLVSESPPLLDLFKTTAHLTQLKTLRLPRSSGFGVHHNAAAFPSMMWPPNLEDVCLSGGIDGHFLHGVVKFPQTLKSLTIKHCPQAKGYAVIHLLKEHIRPLPLLESLEIAHMPRFSSRAVDQALRILPQLKKLSVSADYVTSALVDEGKFPGPEEELVESSDAFVHGNLRTLELTYSGSPSGVEDKITALDIMIAIEEGTLPKLRQVRVDQALLWQSAGMREDVEALGDMLQEAARRDWEDREWLFADMGRREYEAKEVWRKVSGVWSFS